jgi:hypothetical protein
MADLDSLVGKSVGDSTIDPSGASKNNKLMSPNAKDDPDCIPGGTNEQKQFEGGSGKPKGPFGPRGRNF